MNVRKTVAKRDVNAAEITKFRPTVLLDAVLFIPETFGAN